MSATGDQPQRPADDRGQGPPGRLSDGEAVELTEQLAGLAQSRAPLVQGLRAAAIESRRSRLARSLRYLADQVEQGRPLDQVLDHPGTRLPVALRRLLSAAVRSGRVSQVLLELVDHHRFRRDLRRSVVAALAYPLTLLLMVTGVTGIVFALIVPQFHAMFDEFDVRVSLPTRAVLWVSDSLGPALLPGLAMVGGFLILLRLVVGRARWRWYLWGVPVFGRLLQWSGMAELARWLKILLQQGIPLPEALRLASAGARDANIAFAAGQLAQQTTSGRSLSEALSDMVRLPASLIPVVWWGEQTGNLPHALQAAGEMFEGRLRLRTMWMSTVLPPLTFVFVGALVAMVAACLLLPLVSLLRSLTTFTFPAASSQNNYDTLTTGLLSLAILGPFVLAAQKLAYGRRRAAGDDALGLMLTIAGWGLLLVGGVGTICFVAFPLGIVLALMTLAILSMAAAKYRDGERRGLLWVLAVSAERGLPLAPAARAFAGERGDEQGRRATRLAELLEAGVPLPEALDRSGNWLPTDARLAARIGCETRNVGGLLRQAARDRQQINPVWQLLYEKSLYLLLLVGVAGACFAFVTVRVVPMYQSIFDEFGARLPAVTRLTFAWSRWLAGGGWLAVPLYLLLAAVGAIGVFYYMGWLRWEPRLVRWFTRRIDSANIMRALSYTLVQGLTLVDSVRLLGRCYPKAHVRTRLALAGQQIEQGRDWCDSLRARGLITRADAAVLRSAQRVGNLPWALREMADRSMRQLAYRVAALHQVAYPTIVLALALPVALYAVTIVYPLAQLIENMSHG